MAERRNAGSQLDDIPRPIRQVVTQANGDLAIVLDGNNYYWLVNRKLRRVYPDKFSLLDRAKAEAAMVVFLTDPTAPRPRWRERL